MIMGGVFLVLRLIVAICLGLYVELSYVRTAVQVGLKLLAFEIDIVSIGLIFIY